MRPNHRKGHVGIVVKHRAGCSSCDGGRCNCKPSYQASVWSSRDKRRIRREFPTLAAAKSWRHDSLVALRQGTMRAPVSTTLNEAAAAWLEGVRSGAIRNRSGDVYKPSAIRGYDQALKRKVLPELGSVKLTAITRADVQSLVEDLQAEGLDPSTIRNQLMPLRAIYRRALSRTEVAINPTTGLELPAVRGKRDRIASPAEAAKLIAAVPERDRAQWATAFYAGLRGGELQALRWQDVHLKAGVIRVERSWDQEAGPVEPKSKAGRRSVPIPAVLRVYLLEQKMRTGRAGESLVFGRTASQPVAPSTIHQRAQKAWKAAKLNRITIQECRHTFASLMIEAGVNGKTLSTYMGHSSITITFDRYGHLMPGNEAEAAALLDAYLERSTAAPAGTGVFR